MKRILVVTHWYYPRNVPRAFRAKELVHELRKNGYLVDVLIGDYKQFISNEEYSDKLLENREVSNNKVAKFSNNRILSMVKNMINYLVGDRFILTTGTYLYNKIDVKKYGAVISIGLPFYVNLITALKIRNTKYHECVTISDWSDPFYENNDTKVAFYFKNLQKITCSTFDYITIPTEAATAYFKEYAADSKIKVIPQGFDFSKTSILNYQKNARVTFAYAGIFYKEIRNPEKLLEALSKLDRDFVFVLYTITHGSIYTDILLKYKEILGNRLQIHGLIPREECISKLSTMDFLINIENSTSNQIPSKLIDYALTKRPILSFKQDEISLEKIISFIDGDFTGSLYIPLEKFDIKNVGKQFIELVEGKEV
ncbi:hypothetical protein [Paenibacillus wynnii]|uniref:Glycosyltransferase subfamily 4-like N-terminal domain-containing protein n=1 Tax=Paenibacillus wynnii TaxID=268407 RepID=A0A098M724_9BACL|nr:hypothetical protein [Paenibacillus wynnii]KGE18325.1 hypothetical protein PWYN_27820 [Paenibacillus wynnii]